MTKTKRAFQTVAVIIGLLSWQADDALASAFTVTPVRILLGPGANSALLTVRNDSTEPLRFQMSLKAWNQAANGEMQLSDTKDLVFFPALMELQAGEEKRVRVGSTFKAAVITEKSYRIFFEELPPANVAVEQQRGAQVRVLTKMGVPIFIQPPKPVVKGELSEVGVTGGQVIFDVRNVGNAFFTVHGATVTGVGKDGATTFQKKQDGWYVLAGGTRRYQFEIPAAACTITDRVRVEIASSLVDEKGEPNTLTREVMVAGPGACSATTAAKE
jgi:fimbrial chaperone protein